MITAANRASSIAGKLQHACALKKISADQLRYLIRDVDALKQELAEALALHQKACK